MRTNVFMNMYIYIQAVTVCVQKKKSERATNKNGYTKIIRAFVLFSCSLIGIGSQ